jgi:replicative DNA helicase
MELTELTILQNLVNREDYSRKVIPFIEPEYFSEERDREIFKMIYDHIDKYNALPEKTSLRITLEDLNLYDALYKECVETINVIEEYDSRVNVEWLTDVTEKWCQNRAIYNAIFKSIKIIEDDNSKEDTGSLPKILQDALAVSFDNHVGHDFIDDSDDRFEFYQRVEEKLPFHLEKFNEITKGGLSRKTLNIALAGTGVGKSLFMCDSASAQLSQGRNVLYITLEMSEEKIAERIDANLLNIPIQQIPEMSKDMFETKIKRLDSKTSGKMVIKEYPTASANANHFRHLLNELQMKKNFQPDIVFIDYLNICSSARIRGGANVNSYTYIKSIAEELRGLAVEFNVPIVSATQTTRSGFTNSDIGLEDTSESFGLPATADFMFAIISTEELEDMNQILIKQLKNRYNDPNVNKRFVVGIDRPKMRLYDVEESAQSDLIEAPYEETNSFTKNTKSKFGKVDVTL